MDDKNYYKEGSHLIRRVVKLPSSGSTNYLYTIIGEDFKKLYRWLPDKTWEIIELLGEVQSEIFLQEGNNITITGSGTTEDPYIISSSSSGGTDDQVASEVPISTISGIVATDVQGALEALKILIDQSTAPTDLTITDRNTNTLKLNSSTGDDVIVPSATTSLSGLMSGTDKAKMDALPTASQIPSISTKKVTLTSNQVLSLSVTSVDVVPAPSAGKFVQLIGVSFNVKNGSIPFSGGTGELRFNSQGLDTTLQFVSADGAINSGNNFGLAVPVSSTDSQLQEASGIQVSTSVPPTAGNGTIDIYITYQTFNI